MSESRPIPKNCTRHTATAFVPARDCGFAGWPPCECYCHAPAVAESSPPADPDEQMVAGTIPDYPPRHARYIVRRGDLTVSATPCYGMHAPWWVVKTLEGEAPPVPMQDGDEWVAAASIVPSTEPAKAPGVSEAVARRALEALDWLQGRGAESAVVAEAIAALRAELDRTRAGEGGERG